MTSDRTAYVAGFLFSRDRVALVQKNRPAWQAGQWNGIGGHVEVGETAEEAMRREFREETGVDVNQWEPFCTLYGADFQVTFFRAYTFPEPSLLQETDERVAWWRTDDLPVTIPNLNWLIPMALHEAPGKGMPFTVHEQSCAVDH